MTGKTGIANTRIRKKLITLFLNIAAKLKTTGYKSQEILLMSLTIILNI